VAFLFASKTMGIKAGKLMLETIAESAQGGFNFSLETTISRVAARVRQGGHDIPDETIKCRFIAGLKTFMKSTNRLLIHRHTYDCHCGCKAAALRTAKPATLRQAHFIRLE
jgi:predicted ABC-type ATPase